MRCAAHMLAQYSLVLVTAALAFGAARPRPSGKNATAATRRLAPSPTSGPSRSSDESGITRGGGRRTGFGRRRGTRPIGTSRGGRGPVSRGVAGKRCSHLTRAGGRSYRQPQQFRIRATSSRPWTGNASRSEGIGRKMAQATAAPDQAPPGETHPPAAKPTPWRRHSAARSASRSAHALRIASRSAGVVEQPARVPANKSPSRTASANGRTRGSVRPDTRSRRRLRAASSAFGTCVARSRLFGGFSFTPRANTAQMDISDSTTRRG